MPERRTYLLMIKYNNYDGVGSGDGSNRIAVVDPNAVQTDAISGLPIMREVATILGPTFESGTSGPVKEWCINTAAVDPLTGSVLVNSEDGVLYRWDLASNRYSQRNPPDQRSWRGLYAERDRRRWRGLRGQQRDPSSRSQDRRAAPGACSGGPSLSTGSTAAGYPYLQ
jgi:hypothetical protein